MTFPFPVIARLDRATRSGPVPSCGDKALEGQSGLDRRSSAGHGHVVHRRTEPGRPVEPGDDAGEKASPRIGPILMHVGSSAGMTVIGRGTNVLVASEG